jgi:hypothetical protein
MSMTHQNQSKIKSENQNDSLVLNLQYSRSCGFINVNRAELFKANLIKNLKIELITLNTQKNCRNKF